MIQNIEWIATDLLFPHPDNPRLVVKEDIFEAITNSIAESGFQVCYALLVRPSEDGYQIISGHTRHKAAIKVGCEKVPCWVKDLTDEEAFLELIRSNAQGELSPLEIGLHALKYAETTAGGRGKEGGLSGYAKQIGKSRPYISQVFSASKVVSQLTGLDKKRLLDKAQHLSQISKAPEEYWQQLTDLLLENEWSAKQTETVVKAIRDINIPTEYHHWLEPEKYIKKTIAEALSDGDIRTPRDIKNWVSSAEEQLDTLDTEQEVVKIIDDKRVIEHWNLQDKFLASLPSLCQGQKAPSKQKIEKLALSLLQEVENLDKKYQKWQQSKASDEEKKKLERLRILEEAKLKEKYTPVGHNINIKDFDPDSKISDLYDAIITDPPYRLSNDGITVRSGKQVSVNKNFDDSTEAIAPENYVLDFYDYLKPGGYLVVTCTDHLLSDLHTEAIKAGFEHRQNLIWYKRNAPPLLTADRFKQDYEYIYVAVKPGATPYFGYDDIKEGDEQRGALLDIPQCSGKERLGWHDTQKPLELMELLIKAYVPTNGLVLEPFAGSGTTVVAAKKLQRLCHWVEMDDDFYVKTNERIENTQFYWE